MSFEKSGSHHRLTRLKEALNGSFIAFGLASLAILLAWIAGVRVSVQVGTGFAPVQLTALAAIVVAGGLTFALSRCASQIVASRREAETEKYLQNLSEASATFTYVLDMDQHKLIHCNNCLCQFVGYPEARIVRGGLALMRKLTHPDDWPVALKHFADIEHSNTDDVREFEQRLKNKDGEWRWVLFRQTVLERRADGTARITRGTGQDITERKGGEDAVRQAKEMLDRVIDRAGVGMALLATDGRILRVNEALSEFLGYSCDELLQLDFQSITHPEDLELDVTQFNQVLEGSIKSYTMEKRYFRKDGAVVWGTLSVTLLREADGSPLYFLGQVIDITERKSHEELANEYARLLEFKTLELDTANRQLQHMVSVDPLTEVFNRRMLEIRLGDAFELARRFSKPLALIMLDVDHFKKYNDDHGHVAGDEALCAVAKIIRGACRGGDVVARYGGEEFVVVCPDTSVEDALGLAERLRIAIKECDLKPARITCSLGVSAIGPDSREPQDIVEMADHALYQAKAGGRDRVCSFLGPLESPAIARPA